MPKITRKTSGARKIGVYAGDDPTPGVYHGVITSASFMTFNSGAQALNIGVKLEAPDPDSPKAQYDGYPSWTRLFLGDSDFQVERENALYRAVAGKEDVDIIVGEANDKGTATIEKIGNKKPVGTTVLVRLVLGNEYQGERRIEGEAIYPVTERKATPAAPKGDGLAEDDLIAGQISDTAAAEFSGAAADEPEVDDKVEVQAEAPAKDDDLDHHAMSAPALRKYAASKGIEVKGKVKADLLAALDALQGGGEAVGEPRTAEDLEKMTVDEIKAWAKPQTENPEDLDDYEDDDKDGLIEMLVELEFVTAF